MVANWFSFYVLTEEGRIYSCGSNDYGQLGLGNNNDVNTLTKINFKQKIKSIVTGRWSLYVLTEESQIYSCGCNDNGQLGLGNDDDDDVNTLTKINFNRKIKSMVAGWCSFYVLTEEGQIYSCGYNGYG